MNTSILLWLALLGITSLAIVLYLPRRFSGPLTEHERRTAHRGLHRRSFLLVLVTPVTTITGLLLLVPPLVALDVHSHVSRARPVDTAAPEASELGERSLLWPLAREESTHEWTTAVLCRVDPANGGDTSALAAAIVEAARDGFTHDHEACGPAILRERFTTRDFRNVELSLVALADRAYVLTDVVIHAGPRLEDPDPWDVMASTLEQHAGLLDIQPEVDVLGHAAQEQPDRILRLSRARRSDPQTLEVLALVRGAPCSSGTCTADLFDAENRREGQCTLTPRQDTPQGSEPQPRVVSMTVQCGRPLEQLDGRLLVADDGHTSIVTADLPIHGENWLFDAIATAASTSRAFTEEMREHNLRPLRFHAGADIHVSASGEGITIGGGSPIPTPCRPSLDRGPFSWSGMDRPEPAFDGNSIQIPIALTTLDPVSPEYDPTAFYASLYTITWAANSLHEGRCLELAEPRSTSSHLPAHPVLTAEQLEEAAAGLRRGRETLGLILIALAVLSLALGLRRSVL